MFTFLRIERPTSDDLAPERVGGVDHLLHPVDVRGEAGDDDPALAAGERLLEVRARPMDSDSDQPGRSALVESPHSSRMPSRPSSASRATSAGMPSTGVWSNL